MLRRFGVNRRRKPRRLLLLRRTQSNSMSKVITKVQETWISRLNQVRLQWHPSQLRNPNKRRKRRKRWIHCSKELQISKRKKKTQTVVMRKKLKPRKQSLCNSHRVMWQTCCRSIASRRSSSNSQLIYSAICSVVDHLSLLSWQVHHTKHGLYKHLNSDSTGVRIRLRKTSS